MKRKLYTQLQAWKDSPYRKPLLLRGARQTGKTYLLRLFGKQEFANTCYVNFEEDPAYRQFFSNGLSPSVIISQLSIYLEQHIHPKTTLIIFDEIQECPEAITCLKYFQEEAPEYVVAAAGSLLGVKLSETKSFPVGKVDFLELYPLTFFEFLEAIGKNELHHYLQQCPIETPILEPIHQQAITLLKQYFFIGGMPEAVQRYIDTQDFKQTRDVQQAILKSYLYDFAKHAPANEIMKITSVWESTPAQLAKENKKFAFTVLHKGARSREYETALQWLVDAGLIYSCYCISTPRIPLKSYAEKNIFKIFLLDIGLLSTMAQLSLKTLVEENTLFTEFKGAFTENFAAQTLAAQNNALFYWSSSHKAEVDFIISTEDEIFPLEVKAGFSTKAKSLSIYQEKYQPSKRLRLSLLNAKLDGNLQNYPLYLAERISI